MVLGVDSWSDAWLRAASGPAGFWRRSVPREHFATTASAGPELAEALLVLLGRHPEIGTVVDVGAGDAALLACLAAADRGLQLVGVDLRPRPRGLVERVRWVEDCWDVRTGGWTSGQVDAVLRGLTGPALLVATEWLDDLPCRVAVAGPDGHRELLADGSPGPLLPAADQAWVDRWWPGGAKVEVGRSRDLAWAALVQALDASGGLALAVDYGHERADRPAAGSLAGFRDGRAATALPDGQANLTAAVAVDAVEAAGERAGASTCWRRRQAQALTDLLPVVRSGEPLADLGARSRRAALVDRRDWGSHWWLLQQVPARPRVTA